MSDSGQGTALCIWGLLCIVGILLVIAGIFLFDAIRSPDLVVGDWISDELIVIALIVLPTAIAIASNFLLARLFRKKAAAGCE